MDKTFRYAGVSTREGTIKLRVANDQMRVKVLAKTGSKDIDLVELKYPMTKLEAVQYLLKIDFDNGNKAIREALERDLEKRLPKKPKAKKAEAEQTEATAEPEEALM